MKKERRKTAKENNAKINPCLLCISVEYLYFPIFSPLYSWCNRGICQSNEPPTQNRGNVFMCKWMCLPINQSTSLLYSISTEPLSENSKIRSIIEIFLVCHYLPINTRTFMVLHFFFCSNMCRNKCETYFLFAAHLESKIYLPWSVVEMEGKKINKLID